MVRKASILGATLALALVACGAPGPSAEASNALVRTISVPDAIAYPEGIAIDSAGRLYTASALDGTIARFSQDGGSAEIIAEPGELLPADPEAFPGMLGMKLDAAGRLWVMGGRTGEILVLDSRSGDLVKRMKVPGEGSLLNDAAITADAVYITDTRKPVLWRIPLDAGRIGEPEPWIDFTNSPLEYGEGRNLNGIVADPSGSFLLSIQMDKGLLYKIGIADQSITQIDVGSETLTNGDGLVLDGTTLYLVRQAEREIVTLRGGPGFESATVISRFTDPALTWPATAAKTDDALLVVDSQFNRRATADPVRPFSLVAIPLDKLADR